MRGTKYIQKINYLDSYIDILRNIVSSKAMKNEKDQEEFSAKMKRLLKLNSEDDLKFILASFDVLGDTNLAIAHFEKFGLLGATRYDEIGEKYLRLYGILNAVYLHKEAILAICNRFHDQDYRNIKEKIEKFKILDVRHKIGAHSINYRNESAFECYTPNRGSIEYKALEFYNMNPSSSEYEAINLELLINEYLKYVFLIIKNLIKTIIQCIFKTDKEAQKEYLSKVDLISEQIESKVIVLNNRDAKK